jgi:hypothetical protein
LVFVSLAWAGPFSDLKHRLSETKSDDEVIRIIRSNPAVASQPDIAQGLKDVKSQVVDNATAATNFRALVDLGSMNETDSTAPFTSKSTATEIKRSPLYSDPGMDQKRNWLADALERLRNIRPKREKTASNGIGLGLLGPIFTFIVWGLLAMAVLFLLYLAIRHIKWQKTLTRKAKTLLEEDEPDRTLDEWLQLADEHSAAGRFREAVRALYLACLLKFDEFDVAAFHRGETNWEHLNRIEKSPRLPKDLNFRTPTQRFDRVWYGYIVEGMADVQLFRDWYQDISRQLKGGSA